MGLFKRLWSYWWNNAKEAHDKREVIVIAFGAAILALGVAWRILGFGTEPDYATWTEWVGGIVFGFGLFWLPFKRHEETERKYQAEIAELRSKKDKRRTEVMDGLAGLLLNIDDSIDRLQQRTSPFDDAQKGKAIKTRDEILYFFLAHFGKAEAALFFNDQSKHKFSESDWDEPRERSRQHTLQSLKQTSEFLVKFIEKEKLHPTPILEKTNDEAGDVVIE